MDKEQKFAIGIGIFIALFCIGFIAYSFSSMPSTIKIPATITKIEITRHEKMVGGGNGVVGYAAGSLIAGGIGGLIGAMADSGPPHLRVSHSCRVFFETTDGREYIWIGEIMANRCFNLKEGMKEELKDTGGRLHWIGEV